ncbi:hypothetical protein [Pseudoroseomonas cervicalis]|uniref:hypothetical protein n=1 Tax=Teichococcus cervicalis TaxID=204525 RepID=UPI0022F1C0A9|nr:hypothetical protein [Pseudoroseomonas cervicalis]WBV41719.1 hypothetical protein PFY06_10770 [Pseudoroseomonas cervicalis]
MQRRLLLGGVVMLVLLAMAGLGLFALHRNQAEARDAMARLEALHGALDLGREAETAFRLQVQEWKNILLRSHEPGATPRLRQAYEAAAAESAALLGQLEDAAPALHDTPAAPLAREVPALRAALAELGERYAAALAAHDPATPEGARAADAALRGADRALQQRLDSVGDRLGEAWAATARELAARSEARYAETRQLLFWGSLIGLGLVLALLFGLARPRG